MSEQQQTDNDMARKAATLAVKSRENNKGMHGRERESEHSNLKYMGFLLLPPVPATDKRVESVMKKKVRNSRS